MMEYLDLFLTFARIGVMTFGGGYAMLPILEREVCENKHWAEPAELMDYYAIGQCTPGVIAVNCSTFLGNKVKGTLGGIIATLGMVFPSLVIITVIAAVISNFAELMWVQNAFAGIRVCVCVLILNAVIKLWKAAVIDRITVVIFAVVFLGSVFLNLSPVIYVVLAAVAGIVLQVKKIPDKQADGQ
jgi:chromate transporter